MPTQKEKSRLLEIREDYCIGCGLCVRLLPEYYLMKDNKAIVIKMPEGPETMQAILASVEKCPSKAITINKQEDIS